MRTVLRVLSGISEAVVVELSCTDLTDESPEMITLDIEQTKTEYHGLHA